MSTIDIQSNATPFSDLQTMVLEIFKRTDKTTEVKRAINEAYREMASVMDARKLEDQIYQTCTIGQEDYAVPDSILRINHPLRLIEPGATNNSSQSHPLRFLTKSQYDELEPNPNAATINGGRPYAYTIFKNSLLLTDIPDQEYLIELNVGGEPTIMSEATDATIFSPVWDETIKAGALTRLYLGIQLLPESEFWMNIYRYGFTGSKENITGGLELLRNINQQRAIPQLIVRNNDL